MTIYNFSPGPAVLPKSVLIQAAEEMLNWQGSGLSVMEMSHRGAEFTTIHQQALQDLRDLLQIPSNYKILFMQGGAIAENAIVPLNLLSDNKSADYIDTGIWSQKSIKEAKRYGQINIAASSEANAYTEIPCYSTWQCHSDAAYVHICSNETIGGLMFDHYPDTGSVPLVADMSSDILSKPIDISKFGLIYGGAQKNIGPAGLTFVIVREDLLGHAQSSCPSAFNYQLVADNDSMFNTPPTYAIYIAGLVFQWLKSQGGIENMALINQKKADLLYHTLDASDFYQTKVAKQFRSTMNVPFFLADDQLNTLFLQKAKDCGLVQLKGHKLVGGMRASIYNAMPYEGVVALSNFLKDFEKSYA